MDGIRKGEKRRRKSLERWDKSVYSKIKWKSFQYAFGIHVNLLAFFTKEQSKQNNCKREREGELNIRKKR